MTPFRLTAFCASPTTDTISIPASPFTMSPTKSQTRPNPSVNADAPVHGANLASPCRGAPVTFNVRPCSVNRYDDFALAVRPAVALMLCISFAVAARPRNDLLVALLWASEFALPLWAGFRVVRFTGTLWLSALGGVSVIVGFLGAVFSDVIGLSPPSNGGPSFWSILSAGALMVMFTAALGLAGGALHRWRSRRGA